MHRRSSIESCIVAHEARTNEPTPAFLHVVELGAASECVTERVLRSERKVRIGLHKRQTLEIPVRIYTCREFSTTRGDRGC